MSARVKEPDHLMKLTSERKRAFLNQLRAHGVVVEAARQASPGSARGAVQSFRDERKRDPDFDKEWDEAVAEAAGAIELEIHRRAMGFEEQRIDYQGRTTTLTKYSDACILALARARLDTFKTKSEVTVTKTPEPDPNRIDPSKLTHEQKHAIRRLLRPHLMPGRTIPSDN